MRENFEAALAAVLEHEGGWSDHPRDPGGATMKGVTLRTYAAFLGRMPTRDELRAIPDEHLHAIYRKGYWDACRCDDLPAGVDIAVFDFAVNGGPGRSAKLLQRCTGAWADGQIGPNTLGMVSAFTEENGADALVEALSRERQAYYEGLSTFDAFGRGWTRRVSETREMALALCGGGADSATT